MNQYVVYIIGAGMLVLSGLGEFLKLLPAGTFSAVFAAVLGGVAGFHIPNTSEQAPASPPQVPQTLGPGVSNIQTAPIPDKQGRQTQP